MTTETLSSWLTAYIGAVKYIVVFGQTIQNYPRTDETLSKTFYCNNLENSRKYIFQSYTSVCFFILCGIAELHLFQLRRNQLLKTAMQLNIRDIFHSSVSVGLTLMKILSEVFEDSPYLYNRQNITAHLIYNFFFGK